MEDGGSKSTAGPASILHSPSSILDPPHHSPLTYSPLTLLGQNTHPSEFPVHRLRSAAYNLQKESEAHPYGTK